MYQYYKGHKKAGVWHPLEEEQLAVKVLDDESVGFVSVLSASEGPGRGEDMPESAEYSGPFYIDIDSDSIKKSIKAAQKTIQKFLQNGVPKAAIQVWATGKRGFHILLPMSLMTEKEKMVRLPVVYGNMARLLKLPDEIDMTVYSCGKGRMWRVANRKRIDNEKYKVPLTIDETLKMDEALYDQMVSAPRKGKLHHVNGAASANEFLAGLFHLAEQKTAQQQKPNAVYIDPVIRGELEGELPPCMEQMRAYQHVRESKGFNDTSLQFAKGVAAFAENSEVRELINEFATNARGKDTYNTVAKRKSHCGIAYKRASQSVTYDWSCASMLSVLDNKPCAQCRIRDYVFNLDNPEARKEAQIAIKPPEVTGRSSLTFQGFTFESSEALHAFVNGMQGKESKPARKLADDAPPAGSGDDPPPDEPGDAPDEAAGDDADTSSGPVENFMQLKQGMGFINATGNFLRIANFTIQIKDKFLEYIPNLEEERLVAVRVGVSIMGKYIGDTTLEEEAWASKARFLSAFLGMGGASYYGKEDEIQRVRSALVTSMDDSVNQIRRVYSSGIHHQRIGEQDIFSYVEPGWSIDMFGHQDLHTISGKVDGAPQLKNVETIQDMDVVWFEDYLSRLLDINTPYTTIQLLGWYMACFLKQHIMCRRNEFPMLNVNGQAGSGKTQTTCLFDALHGVDMMRTSTPMTISTASEFPVWKYIESSMTVPRIFDEFNKSKMMRTYDKYSEVLKECWNQHTISRGTIAGAKMHGQSRSGAYSLHIPLTGPVVLLSEQSVESPALRERIIQIGLSKNQRRNDEYTENFHYCATNREKMMPFAKTAYMAALALTPDKVMEWIDKNLPRIPKVIDDRPRYSYAVMLMGLDFLLHIGKEVSFSNKLVRKIEGYRGNFIQTMLTEKAQEFITRQRSEVDIVIDKLGIMAAMSGTATTPWLEPRVHYIKSTKDNMLVIDTRVAHAMYIRYMRQMENAPAVIESAYEFMKLLKDEPYCINIEATMAPFAKGRAVCQLDLAKMKEKGLDPTNFEEKG